MAEIARDAIRDTTTSTGTGPFTVSGVPPTGFKTFGDAMTTNDTIDVTIRHRTADEWVTGSAHYSASNELTMDTVKDGSSGAGVAVSFSAGTKDIFSGPIASRRGLFSQMPEVIKTADYTVVPYDAGKAIIANKATAITFNLPTLASAGSGAFVVRNIGVGDLTVDPNSTEQIEGANTLVLKTGMAAVVWPNGSLWRAADMSAPAGLVKTVKTQTFSNSGTYTPSPGMLYALIRLVGGGGGGGGVASSGPARELAAAGGGAGGFSQLLATAASIGASKTVTIGAAGAAGASGANNGGTGGDTSVGTLCIGKGGTGGGGIDYTSGESIYGAGGIPGTGDVASPGANGGPGFWSNLTSSEILSGTGASGPYGSGGIQNYNADGGAATGFGAGGAGGQQTNAATNRAGGAGTKGFVEIIEWCSQ